MTHGCTSVLYPDSLLTPLTEKVVTLSDSTGNPGTFNLSTLHIQLGSVSNKTETTIKLTMVPRTPRYSTSISPCTEQLELIK